MSQRRERIAFADLGYVAVQHESAPGLPQRPAKPPHSLLWSGSIPCARLVDLRWFRLRLAAWSAISKLDLLLS